MIQNTKDLIERARLGISIANDRRISQDAVQIVKELADALERLTQPVGVDAIGWITEDGRHTLDPNAPVKFGRHWRIPIYSAETVEKLIAERDEWQYKFLGQVNCGAIQYAEICALQEQVEILRNFAEYCTDYSESGSRIYSKAGEALAATEPKEKQNAKD